MYAKQAEQYTGESSLNQGDNVSNKSNESEIDKSKHSYHSKDKSLADEHNRLVQIKLMNKLIVIMLIIKQKFQMNLLNPTIMKKLI